MNVVKESVTIGDKTIQFETGKMAKQASGSVVVSVGNSMVLCTAVGAKSARPGMDFLPLTCEYKEKAYAAGKIPGSFFRREGRPSSAEILVCRLMDRPARPLFPSSWRNETQLIANVISYDPEHATDVLAMLGSSAALHLSDVPWEGPYAAVRVGRVDGKFIAFPSTSELANSEIDMVVAATNDAIVMVEGSMEETSEEVIIDALEFAHGIAKQIVKGLESLREKAGKAKMAFEVVETDEALVAAVFKEATPLIEKAYAIREKHARYDALSEAKSEVVASLCAEGGTYEGRDDEVSDAVAKAKKSFARKSTIASSKRIDGRDYDEIRNISCEVGILPSAHGSALFTRGETQALAVATVGTKYDEMRMDTLAGDASKTFYLHYNFPPFCTGEAKMIRSTSRREIGHGNLAERSVGAIMPAHSDFPYTTRIVSEVLESNGSSSMASVCGGSLALMDAGIPSKAAVAGIAMGLMKEGDDYAILSDILGDEDHLGDMDFKVTGTKDGICALQMDIKLKGLPREIMERALAQAKAGRIHILDKMSEALSEPRKELSDNAPRIVSFKVNPEKIRDIIGPGGKTIRGIIEQTGAQVDIDDSGTVSIASSDQKSLTQARDLVEGLTREPEAGVFYKGIIKSIVDFGAFVEVLPGQEGLLHISEIAPERIKNVSDVLSEGDQVIVKCLAVERNGKIKLSRKEALDVAPDNVENFVA